MSTDTIRVGIVGAGTNTVGKHIPELQKIEGVEVVSVCNRSRASSERVAKQFNIPTVYDTWSDLIEAEDSDAIVIGTWPIMHCTLVLASFSAGKHVMTEARMAMNAEEAQVMRDTSQALPELVAQIVPSPMTLWADNTIKRLIAEGYVGDILSVEVSASGDFLDPDAPLSWRQNYDLSGMNIMSMGIWYEGMLRWVGEATRVMAQGKTFVKMRRDAETDRMAVSRVPEHIDVIMDLACGAQGHMKISSVQGLANDNGASIYGTEGTLRITGDQKLLGGRRGDEALQEIPIPEGEGGAWRVEQEFINAIRGQEKITHTSFDTGVKYMEFTEAVNRSMAEGKAISIPL